MLVSDEIKDAFNPNNGQGGRYIDYSVRFEIVNEEAQNNCTITASEDNTISLKDTILTNTDVTNFATFEFNGFALDGSQVVAPTPLQNIGNVGYLSNNISDHANLITETITFVTDYYNNLIATTIHFGFVYAVDFSLKYYDNANALIHTKVVTDNTLMLYIYNYAISNVKKIEIVITKISRAYSRIRIGYFLFGVTKIYDKTNSDTLEITENIDPFNERLPTNELKLVTENFSNEFNIFEPAGIYEYFNERQILRPKIGALSGTALKYIEMGKYFLQKPKLSGNTSKINITATDIFGVMADTVYSSGIYKTATIKQFLNDVLTGFNLSLNCPAWFDTTSITSYIKTQKHSDILKKIAQATNTILYVSKSAAITFSELSAITNTHSFTQDDYNFDGGVAPSDDNIINTIEVEAVSYRINATAEKLAEISGAGTFNIKYEPSQEQTITVTGGIASNVTYYVDNANVTLSAGTAVINGKKIIATKNVVSVNNRRPSDKYYVYSVKDNEFINNQNALNVANYMLNLKAIYRRNVKMNYRGYPYLDLGEKAQFHINDNLTQDFFITKNSLKCAGGMTGTLESRECP